MSECYNNTRQIYFNNFLDKNIFIISDDDFFCSNAILVCICSFYFLLSTYKKCHQNNYLQRMNSIHYVTSVFLCRTFDV